MYETLLFHDLKLTLACFIHNISLMSLSDKVEWGLTIDKVIEKFIPVVWVLFFVIGLGYLLYNSIWVDLAQPIRLGLGFFLSVVIIGGGLSFSERLSYFADVVIGWGILLLYGTLIYWSRTTDLWSATIPENASIVVASIFTIAAAYFASFRKSKVILALVLIGAYITPFVIGGEWGTSSLSFNTYLLYFFVANVAIFLLWREIAIYDLIPLNMVGLLVGTTSLYTLSYKHAVASEFLSSTGFSAVLFTGLVIFSIFAIIFSSQKFESKFEGYLTAWYIAPLLWFMFNISLLGKEGIGTTTLAGLYGIIAVAYFVGWYVLRNMTTRYQHVALYVWGIVSLIAWFFVYFPELNFFSSSIISYAGLIFALIFMVDPTKGERLMTYWLFTWIGGVLALYHMYSDPVGMSAQTFWTTIALLPALLAYPMTWKLPTKAEKNSTTPIMKMYSSVALIIILMTFLINVLQELSFSFAFFILPAFFVMVYATVTKSPMESQWHLLRISVILMTFGFIGPFFFFLNLLTPHTADGLTLGTILKSSEVVSGVFVLVTLFLWLRLSRLVQAGTKISRPSFLLVIFGYTTLLLLVNAFLIVGMNDLGISTGSTGWPRAIAITFWWIVLAVWMISVGVLRWSIYRSEKLLWLLLLGLTVWKIIFYDMGTMSTNNKIVVLMVVGGALMIFSYFFHASNWFKTENTSK